MSRKALFHIYQWQWPLVTSEPAGGALHLGCGSWSSFNKPCSCFKQVWSSEWVVKVLSPGGKCHRYKKTVSAGPKFNESPWQQGGGGLRFSPHWNWGEFKIFLCLFKQERSQNNFFEVPNSDEFLQRKVAVQVCLIDQECHHLITGHQRRGDLWNMSHTAPRVLPCESELLQKMQASTTRSGAANTNT